MSGTSTEAAPPRTIVLRNALRKRALETLYEPRPAPRSWPVGARFDTLYPFVGETLGQDSELTYLEFGVWRGASIKRMAQIFTNPASRFIGFDSFEGLPEDWGDRPSGTFSTEGNQPRINDKRVSFVKGYFQNTLPDFLKSFEPRGTVLINYDADLYSSTLFLLTTLWHHLPEYHFIFDEFPNDEAAAMYDFVQAFPVDYEFLGCTRADETRDVPQQLFGRLRNKKLVL